MKRLVAFFAITVFLLTGCGSAEEVTPQALVAATTGLAPSTTSTAVTTTSATSSSTTTTSSTTSSTSTSTTASSPSQAELEHEYAAALLAAGIDAADPLYAYAAVSGVCANLIVGQSAGTVAVDLANYVTALSAPAQIALQVAVDLTCPEFSTAVSASIATAQAAAAEAARVAEEARLAAEAEAARVAAEAARVAEEQRVAAEAQAAADAQAAAAAAQAAAAQAAAEAAAAEAARVAEAQVPIQPAAGVYYANCTAVKAAGAAPIHAGDPGFQAKFDRDNDGVGCES